MLEKELSFADLSISLSELYEAMGYADAVPDEAVEKEVRGVLGRVEAVTSPRFCFFISGGELDESKDSLSVGDTCFSIGKIITRQLRGSESFAFFAATAGTGFERFQHTLQQEGDMVKVYIADAIGSVIAEKTADCMEIALDEYIRDRGWRHTNRFSPGYCGWHVSEQKKLFPLFPSAEPCGIRLTDSSLMLPIKLHTTLILTENPHGCKSFCYFFRTRQGRGAVSAQLAKSHTSTVYFSSGRARSQLRMLCFSSVPMTRPL